MLRRSAQPFEAMTREVSFNLVRHARIDKIQRDRTKFDENGQPKRSWSWLRAGPIGSRNGSQSLFDKFELIL
jgi:hypothetical protein